MGRQTALIAPEYPAPWDDDEVLRIPSPCLFFDPEGRMMRRGPVHRLTEQLRGRFDVVHMHTPFVAHGAGLARNLGLPVLSTAVLGTRAVRERAEAVCGVPEDLKAFAASVIELLHSPSGASRFQSGCAQVRRRGPARRWRIA